MELVHQALLPHDLGQTERISDVHLHGRLVRRCPPADQGESQDQEDGRGNISNVHAESARKSRTGQEDTPVGVMPIFWA